MDRRIQLDIVYKPEPNRECSSLLSTVFESHLFWKDMHIQLDTQYSSAGLLYCMFHLNTLSLDLMRYLDNETLVDTMYKMFVIQLRMFLVDKSQYHWSLFLGKRGPLDKECNLSAFRLNRCLVGI